MGLTQEDVIRHQNRQADLQKFIQVLTPLVASPNTPEEIRTIASAQMKEYLSMITIGIPESVIRKL